MGFNLVFKGLTQRLKG